MGSVGDLHRGNGEGVKGPNAVPRFKAQTRLWDYAATPANRLDELTSILVDQKSGVKDQDATRDSSPLESQRSWERQAEENILARLEKGGLLAPAGPVDDVLNTVVNNLIVSANLNVEAHCRVLLTTPVETFSVGHTIVISRGLIDVLPDEVSLALVLAAELSHIALGHPTPTQFAFHNQTMLSDAELLQKFHFERTPQEMAAAGKKDHRDYQGVSVSEDRQRRAIPEGAWAARAGVTTSAGRESRQSGGERATLWPAFLNSPNPRRRLKRTKSSRLPRYRLARALS